MEQITAIVASNLAKKLAVQMAFLPLLCATIKFFRSDVIDIASAPSIDLPGESLLSHYDFVIVGGGSAGKNNSYYSYLLKL